MRPHIGAAPGSRVPRCSIRAHGVAAAPLFSSGAQGSAATAGNIRPGCRGGALRATVPWPEASIRRGPSNASGSQATECLARNDVVPGHIDPAWRGNPNVPVGSARLPGTSAEWTGRRMSRGVRCGHRSWPVRSVLTGARTAIGSPARLRTDTGRNPARSPGRCCPGRGSGCRAVTCGSSVAGRQCLGGCEMVADRPVERGT